MIDITKIKPIGVEKMYEKKDYTSILENYNNESLNEEKEIKKNDLDNNIIYEEENIDIVNNDMKNNKLFKKIIIIIILLIFIIFSFFVWKNINIGKNIVEEKTKKSEVNIIKIPENKIEQNINVPLLSEKNNLSKESINNPIISTEKNNVIEKIKDGELNVVKKPQDEKEGFINSSSLSEKNNLSDDSTSNPNFSKGKNISDYQEKPIEDNIAPLPTSKTTTDIKDQSVKNNEKSSKIINKKENIAKVKVNKVHKKEKWEIEADKQLDILDEKLK